MDDIPFWTAVSNSRAEDERTLLQCMLRRKLREGSLDSPDCWMHRDRSRFSNALVAGQFDIPMYPCRTVMSTPHFNDTIDHHQLYVGNGMYVRMYQFRTVQLGFLPEERSVSRKLFRVVSYPKARPEQVMRRVILSLGDFSWSPRGANCHSVTTWQLFGQGDSESLFANDVSQLYSLTWLLWLSLFILSVLLVIKGFHDCAKIHRIKPYLARTH
jgi:hypothetical protein